MTNSRIIVKNLPKLVTEAKIRELFSKQGTITDVQLKYTTDGRFRHFGFIGFSSEIEAESARNYFDQTFIGASKIDVKSCANLGDPNKPRAWSKYSKDSSEGKKRKGNNEDIQPIESKKPKVKKKEEEILEKCREDPDFLEFLESHRMKSTWGNDAILDELEKLGKTLEGKKLSKDLSHEEIEPTTDEPEVKFSKIVKNKIKAPVTSDSEPVTEIKTKKKRRRKNNSAPVAELFTITLRGLPEKANKKDIKEFLAPLQPKSIRIPPNFRGFSYVGFKTETELRDSLRKDKSFMLGSRIAVRKFDSNKQQAENITSEKLSKWAVQTAELEKECETVGESGRIFIRNLAYTSTEEQITEIFEKFGPVTEVHLPLDRLTRKIKGFGFISFFLPEHATKAFNELDGTIFQGRMLHLLPSKAKEELSADSSTTFKNAKSIKDKKAAGSSHNWNTLFMGQNAVAHVVSEKYGVSREELLLDKNEEVDRKQASIGVRMALAEAEIVHETRNFLSANDVYLEAFENTKAERSKTIILVKNLQANTAAKDLVDLFSKYGEIGRVILPPSGVTAIVEFIESAEARAAFKKLAYTKFGGMPLYLEWAPLNIFVSRTNTKNIVNQDSKSQLQTTPIDTKVNDVDVKKRSSKLLVRNVPFQATQSEVKQLFITFGEIKACRLPLKNDGSGEHRGFAFVDFLNAEIALKAYETLGKSTHLYGRRLVLEWAQKEETVQNLREKTAKQFDLQTAGGRENKTSGIKKGFTRYFNSQESNTKGKAEVDEDD